ncbi:MAG: 4Fe-4S binding protein [Peptococcaceae bacterium]|nr:4Fe-4S binding protein [Peptococcaceae bacterium]
MRKKEEIKQGKKRFLIQMLFAALINGYALGFSKGQIFTGNSKLICVPVLNCYSCPGALGACPIGALQAVIGGHKHNVSFYVFGTIMLFGVVLGRLICGFLCPFGLVQDLLHKIPSPKIHVSKNIDTPLRWLKYLVLIVLVILLPMILTNDFGIGAPYFCKWICPAGTLGGAFPLLIQNESLRATIGGLFTWKVTVLAAISIASIVISRPFCKYLCPLGALYGLFNRFSFYQLHLNREKCTKCGSCERNCPMTVEITRNINSAECIRCGKCKAVCPHGAITSGFSVNTRKERFGKY